MFLAANPSGTDPRALDREARSIRAELKRSGYRDRFEFETRWAAEPLDLLRELRELKPAVVHFSGHGGQGGLCFQSADGRAQIVSPAALAEAFHAAGAAVKLVVLSACYSEVPAEALLAHVDCVVGLGGAIHADAARSFAIGFYGGLGEHESVAAAYQQGRAAISLEGLPEGDRPQLKVRAGLDADQLILTAVTRPALVELPCPYPGMRPYAADDAEHFHGRGAEIDDLLGRLRAGEREIYVIGPSGSGKSSLVAAGLLPRLARGAAGLGPFLVRSMRPGEQPAARLGELLEVRPEQRAAPASAVSALLAHRGPGAFVLIVVDQLEELFTLAGAGEREPFLRALEALRAEPRCVVVFTLRADFFGAFMESTLWTDRRGRISRIEVGPLRGGALREAIAQPARDLGVIVEPELIERLLADAASEPGILPLLQETMIQLWERRRDQTLTLADYQALGDGVRSGLAVAVSRRADATLRALTSAQEAIARRILLRLISFGEGRSDTRRQQPRSELRAAGDDAADFEHVLRTLTADRLLTTDDDDCGEAHVDLAHEVVIAAWPTLAGWIQTHRVDEQRRRQLEAAAAQWAEHGRGARGLLDPIELADADAWQRTESARELGQSADVAALIAASRAAHEQQRRRRRGLVGGAFATLAVIAIVVATLAIMARRQAREAEASRREIQRLLAQSYQETGRQLLLEDRPGEAVPYLVAAREKGQEGESLRMLFWAAARALPLTPPLEHQGPVVSAAFSPDGTRVVTATATKTARLWNAATGKLLATLEHQGHALTIVWSAAFSPDGTRIVTASDDKTARIWDAATGKRLATLAHQGTVRRAVFSPDGTRLVTASDDHTARVWNAATGTRLATLEHQGIVWHVAFNPDGTRVVTASADGTARARDVITVSDGHTARVWDVATGKLFATLQGKLASAAFGSGSTRVVTTSNDKTAWVWDATTGKLLATLQHQLPVASAVPSSDGARIVTTDHSDTVQIWDAATGKRLTTLQHQEQVASAAPSFDGVRVVTMSYNTTAQIWDAVANKLIATLQHQEAVRSAAFSPDGSRVVTVSGHSTVRVWDAATGSPLTPPLEHQGHVDSIAFSPDGTRIVTVHSNETAWIWDASASKLRVTSIEHGDTVASAAFSPDGARVVTASYDKIARVWDAATGKPLAAPHEYRGPVKGIASSPDGTRAVVVNPLPNMNTARIWDVATDMPLGAPLTHRESVVAAAFSSDSTRVVTASADKTAQIWDAATGLPLASFLGHEGSVLSAAFSPDGTRVVTASGDQTARIWTAATGELLLLPLKHPEYVRSAAFSPDGTRVVTTSDDNAARIWDTATGKLLATLREHPWPVLTAAFSPDGTRVVTGSGSTAYIWEIGLDNRTLTEWSALAERSPFVLSGSIHVRRPLRERTAMPLPDPPPPPSSSLSPPPPPSSLLPPPPPSSLPPPPVP